jgi:hypothetical protein
MRGAGGFLLGRRARVGRRQLAVRRWRGVWQCELPPGASDADPDADTSPPPLHSLRPAGRSRSGTYFVVCVHAAALNTDVGGSVVGLEKYRRSPWAGGGRLEVVLAEVATGRTFVLYAGSAEAVGMLQAVMPLDVQVAEGNRFVTIKLSGASLMRRESWPAPPSGAAHMAEAYYVPTPDLTMVRSAGARFLATGWARCW